MGGGLFISLEGIEGTGKSTQTRILADAIRESGREVVLTVEPGGTDISRAIRGLLLDVNHGAMDAMTELLLYAAARRQHMAELILPALGRGAVVVTDRFSDSTVAYQGYARGLDMSLIQKLDGMVTGGMRPNLTLLLDMDVETGLRRNKGAGKVDRLELEDVAFHKRVREGFLSIAKAEPARVKVIDASGSLDDVARKIRDAVAKAAGVVFKS